MEKKIILDSIKLSDFSGEELLTVIKESGLFSEKKIMNSEMLPVLRSPPKINRRPLNLRIRRLEYFSPGEVKLKLN